MTITNFVIVISLCAQLNLLICRIPRASPGMMCVCRRGRLADKDLSQPAIGLQQTGPTGAGLKAARADPDRQRDAE
jgi:hypothetical protein